MTDEHRDIPIVDCHQHFWRLDQNYYPWLSDEKQVHFRYGDYSVIKRNYLPPDYKRDIGTNRVVKTVHEEAWADRKIPSPRRGLSTRSRGNTNFPTPSSASRGLPAMTSPRSWPVIHRASSRAAYAISRRRRRICPSQTAANPARWTTRNGGVAWLRFAGAISLFRRHQVSWRQADALSRIGR